MGFRTKTLLMGCLLTPWLSSCGGEDSTPLSSATPTASPTVAPVPSSTPVASATPTASPTVTPTPSSTPLASATPTASPTVTPTPTENFTLEAEDYDTGAGFGRLVDSDDGRIVPNIGLGDYLEFTTNIDQPGLYEVTYRVASSTEGTAVELFLQAQNPDEIISAGITSIYTGDSNTYQSIDGSQAFNILNSGEQTIKFVGANADDGAFNANYFTFQRIGGLDANIDSDADGVPDINDYCAFTPVEQAAEADGCAPSEKDTDNDGITDDLDECMDSSPDTIVSTTGCVFTGDLVDVDLANPTYPSFMTFDNITPNGKKWEPIASMSDEFDIWDDSKWVKTNWNYGDTPVNMLNKNSGVSDGYLWIQATLNEESENQWFETSRVRSQDRKKFPMYTEARIKTTSISAYSTYWLNNGDGNNRDEIDIIENNPNPTCNCQPNYTWQMNSQYFIVKNGVTERHHGNHSNQLGRTPQTNVLQGVPWDEAFHVYGAYWIDEHTVQFYLNGEPAGRVDTTQAFTLDQHIIFDLWTQDSSWVGGLPAKTDLLDEEASTMKIDWVRTWQLVDE